MVKKLIITGCIEAIVLTVAALIQPQLLIDNAIWVIVAASAILMAVAFYDSRMSRQIGGATSLGGHSTHGPNSPVVGNVGGNLTQVFHPPAQEEKPEKSTSYTLDNLDGLARALGATIAAPRQRGRCPEMPIWQALSYIAGRVGDTNVQDSFPAARQQFRQAASEGQIEVWGQLQIPPAHMQDDRHKDIWSYIDPEHWESFALEPLSASMAHENHPHTRDEEIGRREGRYWNLRVRDVDIKRRWPEPPKPAPPKPDLGPHGWMAG